MGSSKLLKITGIIMIIGGALITLLCVFGIVVGSFAISLKPDGTQSEAEGIMLIVFSIITIGGAILELIAGIMGAKNWNKPAKANGCFVIGIVLITLHLISNIISVSTGGFNTTVLTNILIGLVLPLLYTYGAAQLKKSA